VMCSPHTHPDQRAKIHQEFEERFGVKVIDSGISAPSSPVSGYALARNVAEIT
jgi:hypothetical protein